MLHCHISYFQKEYLEDSSRLSYLRNFLLFICSKIKHSGHFLYSHVLILMVINIWFLLTIASWNHTILRYSWLKLRVKKTEMYVISLLCTYASYLRLFKKKQLNFTFRAFLKIHFYHKTIVGWKARFEGGIVSSGLDSIHRWAHGLWNGAVASMRHDTWTMKLPLCMAKMPWCYIREVLCRCHRGLLTRYVNRLTSKRP